VPCCLLHRHSRHPTPGQVEVVVTNHHFFLSGGKEGKWGSLPSCEPIFFPTIGGNELAVLKSLFDDESTIYLAEGWHTVRVDLSLLGRHKDRIAQSWLAYSPPHTQTISG
jgi:hypothetical protein